MFYIDSKQRIITLHNVIISKGRSNILQYCISVIIEKVVPRTATKCLQAKFNKNEKVILDTVT